MSRASEICANGNVNKLRLALLPLFALSLAQPCRGGDGSSLLFPDAVEWVAGPARANLGAVAEIKVPEGYKFTGAQGASSLLSRHPNSGTKNPAGILEPVSGDWLIIFEYIEIGSVRDADKESLDAETILKAVRSQIGPSASWELEPVYDAAAHSLEWAVSANSGPGTPAIINHSVHFLGRHGILRVDAVLPPRGNLGSVPLKQLVQGVTFKEGERYTDYQEGDKLSSFGLAQLITGASPANTAAVPVAVSDQNARSTGAVFWVVFILSGCAAAAGGLLVLTKLRRQKARKLTQNVPGPALATAASHGRPATPAPIAAAATSAGNGAKPARLDDKGAAAGKSQNDHRSSRRRKSVDYTKFFMDLRSTVSDHATYIQLTPVNGHHHHRNGAAEAVAPAAPEAAPAPPVEKLAGAHAEMIAHQRNLIEEQQRLIHEQTKLIEEKSKLVAEKSQLLERQLELIEDRLLPS